MFAASAISRKHRVHREHGGEEFAHHQEQVISEDAETTRDRNPNGPRDRVAADGPQPAGRWATMLVARANGQLDLQRYPTPKHRSGRTNERGPNACNELGKRNHATHA